MNIQSLLSGQNVHRVDLVVVRTRTLSFRYAEAGGNVVDSGVQTL